MRKEHIVIVAFVILFIGVSLAWIVSSQLREKKLVFVVMFSGEDYAQNNNYRLTTGNFTISGSECVSDGSANVLVMGHTLKLWCLMPTRIDSSRISFHAVILKM